MAHKPCCGGKCPCSACCDNLARNAVVIVKVSGFGVCSPQRNGKFRFSFVRQETGDKVCYFGSEGPWSLRLLNVDGTCKWQLKDSTENYKFELATGDTCCPASESAMTYTGDTSDGCAGASPAATLVCSEDAESSCLCTDTAPSHLLVQVEGVLHTPPFISGIEGDPPLHFAPYCCEEFNMSWVLPLRQNDISVCSWSDEFFCEESGVICCDRLLPDKDPNDVNVLPQPADTVGIYVGISNGFGANEWSVLCRIMLYERPSVSGQESFGFNWQKTGSLISSPLRCSEFSRFALDFGGYEFSEQTGMCGTDDSKLYITAV